MKLEVYIIIIVFYRERDFRSTLSNVLQASRAPNTVKKYNNAVAAWQVWCNLNHISFSQPTHLDLAKYFVHMFNNGAPYSTIETAFYAIKWKLDSAPELCLNNPCDLKFLRLLLDGFKRILSKPVNRKEPISPEILQAIVQKFDSDDVKNLRICCMFLLAYAGFLRYDEISRLKLCDIELNLSHVKLFLEQSKTDQFREGAWVVIGATGKSTCPVAMLSKYLKCAGLTNLSLSEYLFRPITFLKAQNKYVLRDGKFNMSYGRCREVFKDALEQIGVDSKHFGFHSLRAGGASAAAAVGVPDRLFKRHGRWASDTSKDRYVKETLQNKMLVSLNLGI